MSQHELRRIQRQLRRDYRLEKVDGGTRITAGLVLFCLAALYALTHLAVALWKGWI